MGSTVRIRCPIAFKYRYKQRGMQFTSAEDSRALRAVDSRVGRKAQRDALLSRKRMDGLGGSSANLAQKESELKLRPALADMSSVFPKKSERELGLQRYEDLLKWREDRRKKLNVEKRQRKPSFKTGVYQPDLAKFLVSDDVEVSDSEVTTPVKPTPFKYLQKSSSKYGFTPGSSSRKVPRFCSGVTPGVSTARVPKFNLRTTPNQSLGRAAILQRRTVDQKENLHKSVIASQDNREKGRTRLKGKSVNRMDMKRVLRSRGTKRHDFSVDEEDLGVKALPATPVTICLRKRRRSEVKPQASLANDMESSEFKSTFAPENFAFNFSVQQSMGNEKDTEPNLTSRSEATPDRRVSKGKKTLIGKDKTPRVSESMGEQDYIITDNTIGVTSSDETVEEICDGDEDIPRHEVDDRHGMESIENSVDMKEISQEMEEMGIKEETMEQAEEINSKSNEREEEIDAAESAIHEKVEVMGDTEVDSVVHEGYLCNFSLLNKTPMSVHRRSTRRSTRLSSCVDTTLSPTMSKLRPRTPCSRSTRRSMSAHTDHFADIMYTPRTQASLRRSVRRSATKGLKSSGIQLLPVPLSFNEPGDEVVMFNEMPMDSETVDLTQDHIIEEEMEDETVVTSVNDNLATPKEAGNQESPKQDMVVATPKDKSKKTPTQDKVIATPKEDNSKRTPKQYEVIKTPKETGSMYTPKQDEVTATPKEDSSKVTPKLDIETPSNSRRKGKVSWLVKESPFINTEKRSTKSRRSGVPPDMKALFDDIPIDGSPLPAHLTPLLDRSRRDLGQSPVLAVAQVDEQLIQDVPLSPTEENCSNLLELLKPSTPPAREDTPDINVWGEESPERPDDFVTSVAAVNTDAVVPTTVPTPVKRRSCRVSLLPGMNDSPINVGKLSVLSEDLICWETPVVPAKKTSKEKIKATPSRRSRRVSKAFLE